MKKIYLLALSLLVLTAGCSKDFLKSYDKRIIGGTWELYDINSFGVGSSRSHVFNNGYFTFYDGGELEYTDLQGQVYNGSWDMRYGYRGSSGSSTNTLFINVVNFQTQEVLSEYFDEIIFTGTNRFKAQIDYVGRTYTYKFKR